jgi:autotransporter-associated beta strand protein
MKPRILSTARPSFLLAAATAALVTSTQVFAANLTWDITSGDNPTITAGSGAWNTTAGNLVWNNNANPNVVWSQTATDNADNAAIFAGADGTLLVPHVVTISGTMAAESITFNSSHYQITGGTLALKPAATGNNGPIIVAADKTATINSAIAYNNNTGAAITVNTGGILNLGGGASNAQYSFTGGGTVNMTNGTYQANTGQVNVASFNQTGGTFGLNQGNTISYTIGSNAGQNVNYTISGGNLTSNANNAAHTDSRLVIGATTGANTATLTVKTGATVSVGTTAAGQLRIGGDANSNGVLDVQGGTLTVGTNKPLNSLYFFVAGADASRSAVMTQSGGTVTTGGIQFGGSSGTYNAASSATLTLSGGNLYVGTLGITRGSAAGALPVTIQLQGGTLGADQDWSSSLDMKLGTTGGGPTIRSARANGEDRTITLSGNLSNDGAVNGTLKKTGGGGLILNGNNSYSGGTTIDAGRLFVSSANALPTTGAVQVNAGTLVINASGSPTFNQSITLASGAALSVRQAATLGNVNLPTTGTVIFNKDDAVTAAFSLGNNVALTGNLTAQVGGTNTNVGAVTLGGDISGSGFGLTKTEVGKLTLDGTNTYDGATLVSAGTLFVTGSLTSDVSVSDTATLGGGGTVGGISFGGGSFFDIALAIGGNALDSTATISFASTGFGIDNLRFNGTAVDWSTIADDTYTLIIGDLNETLLDNFGVANAFDIDGISGTRTAYFKEGSLQLVVIPEPRAALLGGLGLLALLRRRRN